MISLFWLWASCGLVYCLLVDMGWLDFVDGDWPEFYEPWYRDGGLWEPWLLIIALPAIAAGAFGYVRFAVVRKLDEHERQPPHCRQCGYLLIGIEEKTCPECGEQHDEPTARSRHATAAVRSELLILLLASLGSIAALVLWSKSQPRVGATPIAASALAVWWLLHSLGVAIERRRAQLR